MSPALIIIDVQKGIDQNDHWGGNRNNPEAEGNIKLLLNFWREKQFPIVIVKHDSLDKTSPLYPGQEGNGLKEFVRPIDGELIVAKSTPSAFIKTDLESILRTRGVDLVYVAGFVTNNSVESTARMSAELGFRTTVVSDATACFNKRGGEGTIYSSELIHQVSLANLAGEYAEIETTAGIIRKLTNLNPDSEHRN
jgi:nicotinamidase-related amidase